MLGPLIFLTETNHLIQGLMSDVKLFAIDAALFLFVDCYETFASARNSNSFEIKEFVCQDFI